MKNKARITPDNAKVMTLKQVKQMARFAQEVQSPYSYENVTLLSFMDLAYNYCLRATKADLDTMQQYTQDLFEEVGLFVIKYYPHNVAKCNNSFTETHSEILSRYLKPRFSRDPYGSYEQMEQVWFIMAMRACHRFLKNVVLDGLTKDHFHGFSETLNRIALMMRSDI